MTKQRRLAGWAMAALLVAASVGCTAGGNNRATTDPAQTTRPAPSPSSTTLVSTGSTAAAVGAESVVRRYFATVDQVRQQPGTPLTALNEVAISGELSTEQRLIRSERQKGLRQVGDTRIARLAVQSVNLDNSDPKAGRVPAVQVDVCWNVIDVDVLDRSGDSVVSPSRPDTGWIRFTVANYDWSTDPTGGWRVASSQDLAKTPCAAS